MSHVRDGQKGPGFLFPSNIQVKLRINSAPTKLEIPLMKC